MTTIALKDYGGLKLPSEFYDLKEKIKYFEVRNEDVWVTSYPKSGTTWCQEMVWLIGNNLNYEGAQVALKLRFPFIEFNGIADEVITFLKAHNIPANQPNLPNFLQIAEEAEDTRYIKSHLPWEFLPMQIADKTKTPKIIHIMRNPKQVVPSYYDHLTSVYPGFIGNLEEFVDFFIKGEILYGGYFRNVLSYWKHRDLPNLLILTYEEMHSDIEAVIKKVSDFLGKSYSKEEIKKLAHHLSFAEMKKNAAFRVFSYLKDKEAQLIRKGAIDSYKQELTPETIKRLDQWISENITGTGLPYESC